MYEAVAETCRLNTVCALPTVDRLVGTTQAFLYCSQHTKLLLCEVEELRALWALLFCSSLTQSKTVSEPTVHGEPKQILSCILASVLAYDYHDCFCVCACLQTAGGSAQRAWGRGFRVQTNVFHVTVWKNIRQFNENTGEARLVSQQFKAIFSLCNHSF